MEQKTCQSIINNVNQLVKKHDEGRLFAVVQVMGKQYKITDGDIIILEGYWAPTIGDKIRLEKVHPRYELLDSLGLNIDSFFLFLSNFSTHCRFYLLAVTISP